MVSLSMSLTNLRQNWLAPTLKVATPRLYIHSQWVPRIIPFIDPQGTGCLQRSPVAEARSYYSRTSPAQVESDPQNFFTALQYVNIPPDYLFTVRFGGDTWHQFAPALPNCIHPAFFALSCHTNELGGDLPDSLREKVTANEADIPSLTELLPESVTILLRQKAFGATKIPTTSLSLDAPAGSLQSVACLTARGTAGAIRGTWSKWRGSTGFATNTGQGMVVRALAVMPSDSLLRQQFKDEPVHHEDTFSLILNDAQVGNKNAPMLRAELLEGFMENSPANVSRMMAFRNVLVKPIGLRTSPLGCPVSSLLSPKRDNLFANRFPVHGQLVNADSSYAQVILGANDKHLKFRSCVSAKIINQHQVEYTLGTRVQCTNLFGNFYMAVIDRMHRGYVTPTMLRMAVGYATRSADAGVTKTSALALPLKSVG
jgi:Protein of unknown function (DUF2867)